MPSDALPTKKEEFGPTKEALLAPVLCPSSSSVAASPVAPVAASAESEPLVENELGDVEDVSATDEEDEAQNCREKGTIKRRRRMRSLSNSAKRDASVDVRRKRGPKHDFDSASYGQMLRYADRWDWLLLAVGMCSALFTGAITPIQSLIFRGITDVLMEGQNEYENGTLEQHMDTFCAGMLHYVLLYITLGIMMFIFVQIAMGSFTTLCERQILQIERRLFQALLSQEPAWFDRPTNQVGALAQKMASGMDRIREGMSDKLAVIFQSLAACVAGILYAFYMSWQMALVMLLVFPFMILAFFGSASAVSRAVRKEMSAYSAAGAVAEEVLAGIRTVAAFNAQQFELTRYKRHLVVGRRMGIRKALMVAFFGGLHLLVMFGSMGVAFWYGTSLALEGRISPGTVFAVFWSVLIGASRIGQALPQMGVIMGAKLAAGEMFAIIDRKPALDCTSSAGIRPNSVKGGIEFSNIHFSYPSRRELKVLKSVCLRIEPGESVALVGHSGCGKSTMVALLMRFYEATKGCLTLDGIPLRDLNVQWLRQTVGLVQQEPVLFAATVEANLRMGREEATTDQMVTACRMANAYGFISKLPQGFNTRVGHGGVQLSGGQKQRLAIARVLIGNPRILLLDEATSALDAESEQLVQEAIDQASSGRTTITIAHRLSTIGNHEELMRRPDSVYRQLVIAQQIETVKPKAAAVGGEDDALSGDEFDRKMAASPRSFVHPPDSESERKMARMSERMRHSMSSVKSAGLTSTAGGEEAAELEDLHDELHEMGVQPASPLDILRYAGPEMPMIAVGVFTAFLRGTSWPLFSVIYGRLFMSLSKSIGLLSSDHHPDQLSLLSTNSLISSSAFVGLGVLAGLSTFASGSLLGAVGECLTQRLRLDVFRSILSQDGYFFDNPRHSTGKLAARLATDAPNVQAAIDQRLAEVLQGVVSLIAGIAVAFYFGWKVAPIGLGTSIILVILQSSVSNYLKRRGMRDLEAAEEASKVATESLEYVRTVQALNRQPKAYRTFCEATRTPHRMAITRGLWTSLSFALTASFVSFNFGFTYWLGMLLIRAGHTTPFVLFQVVEALNMASFMIMSAAAYFPEYLRARFSAGLMFAMALLQPRINSLSDDGIKSPIEGRLELKSVAFAYPNGQKQLALDGLSLAAPEGRRIAVVGPSGCGKSTVVQLLERHYDPIGGSIFVDGVNIRQYNIKHLRHSMALVSQEPTLFNLSIRENIAYGLTETEATEERVLRAAKMANIHQFVETLPQKYETPVGGRGTQLSGGQKQRVAIARAIVRDPRILLLDEATSALDTESEKVVQKALEKAGEGRTCVVIAHRLATVQTADLIVVMRDGRVAEMGTHQQLLQLQGLYYGLIRRQATPGTI
uniref:ABC-type xenobiotic transporter n=1 Tax=Globodera rostochiensis TaxID=31243 RepID=A0A914HYY5_GLORO